MIRLNRYIASSTKYSRRQADDFIRRGQVKVNDKIINDFSVRISSGDVVKLDEKIITPLKKVYYLVNKPVNYVTTVEDKYADKIITDLVPKNPPVFPVGRLDKNSRGLMIMTNDGELAQKLTHPKFEKEKEYEVLIDHALNTQEIKKLKQGIKLEQGIGKFDKIETIRTGKYRIIIHQGRKRQIREMFKSIGYKVKDLQRVRIAKIKLMDLSEGDYRQISKNDILKLIDK